MKYIFLSEDELSELIRAAIRPVIKEELSSMAPAIHVNDRSEFLSRKQAADLLGISLPTLGDYIKRGKIKAYRIGRRIRLKQSDIESSLIVIRSGLQTSHINQPHSSNGVNQGV